MINKLLKLLAEWAPLNPEIKLARIPVRSKYSWEKQRRKR